MPPQAFIAPAGCGWLAATNRDHDKDGDDFFIGLEVFFGSLLVERHGRLGYKLTGTLCARF